MRFVVNLIGSTFCTLVVYLANNNLGKDFDIFAGGMLFVIFFIGLDFYFGQNLRNGD